MCTLILWIIRPVKNFPQGIQTYYFTGTTCHPNMLRNCNKSLDILDFYLLAPGRRTNMLLWDWAVFCVRAASLISSNYQNQNFILCSKVYFIYGNNSVYRKVTHEGTLYWSLKDFMEGLLTRDIKSARLSVSQRPQDKIEIFDMWHHCVRSLHGRMTKGTEERVRESVPMLMHFY